MLAGGRGGPGLHGLGDVGVDPFEGVGGRAVMAGSGAKVMRPVARRELRLYVREGYLDP